ncbi:unnamed protein product [Brassicogethes aeneus]|uniref:SCP domain-containing protein n=1 Tax=Brassicogethes aeneus TaxID=1431903 RepID=A0A9P0B9A5_BRAAE|nr:unnamed protein product [Brassicogethes aeneus]
MDLPRVTSQSSLCPTDHSDKSRTPASQKLLVQQQQQKALAAINRETCGQQPPEPQFAILPSAHGYRPSRKREEALALQNLRRRLQAVRVMQANKQEPVEALGANNNISAEDIDNRPKMLKKILHNRPVSIVLDISEIRTAWQDSDFITDSLCWHNVYRQRHGSPPLSMSSELCYLAQTWANHLAHSNRFYYRNDKDIGQNLFCRPANSIELEVTGQEVSTYWYSAVRQYDFRREPENLHVNANAGHFTQVVWASSKHFGVGKARSRSGKIVVVAHYHPAGNINGLYMDNVLSPSQAEQASLSIPGTGRFLCSGSSTAGSSRRSSTCS